VSRILSDLDDISTVGLLFVQLDLPLCQWFLGDAKWVMVDISLFINQL